MKYFRIFFLFCLTMLVVSGAVLSAEALTFGGGQKHAFTQDFFIEECTFSSIGSNTYFVLVPGHEITLAGFEGKEEVNVVITVLDETKMVDGVETRIVQEVETKDGELAEISWNYFAVCTETNSAYYFGEDVDIYEDGLVVSHDGAWLAGENDAQPGIIMPGQPLLGARYFQEIAPDVAMDRAEIVRLDAVVGTPAGIFDRCLETRETTPLEPSSKDSKFYARGIGLIVDGPLFLTGVVMP